MIQQYLPKLKDHRVAIADFIHRMEENDVHAMDVANMLKRIRELGTWSSASNYVRIESAARALEDALIAHAENDEVRPRARELYSACHEALNFYPVTLPAHNHPHTSSTSGLKPVLLTADDDRSVRAMMEAIFASDAHVISAQDGPSALEAIRSHNPDVVLLDDTMPGFTGLRLLEILKEENPFHSTCIIMLTSSDRDCDAQRAYDAGALDYVMKPFDPQALALKVRAVFKRIV